jgi:hypothetical protein
MDNGILRAGEGFSDSAHADAETYLESCSSSRRRRGWIASSSKSAGRQLIRYPHPEL